MRLRRNSHSSLLGFHFETLTIQRKTPGGCVYMPSAATAGAAGEVEEEAAEDDGAGDASGGCLLVAATSGLTVSGIAARRAGRKSPRAFLLRSAVLTVRAVVSSIFSRSTKYHHEKSRRPQLTLSRPCLWLVLHAAVCLCLDLLQQRPP